MAQNQAKFRTELMVEPSKLRLGPYRPVAAIGSCFSANISARMRRALWKASDPLGTLFNPMSIARIIELTIGDEEWREPVAESLFEAGGAIHSWLLDSSFSSIDRANTLERFEQARGEFRKTLSEGRCLMVTFGTAYCYYRRGEIVANCHKQPAAEFERRRVSIDEITDRWDKTIAAIEDAYPDTEILFTVSPVRHVRDGLAENCRSKSTLLLAVERICETHGNCHYFPAYEILNDDLRDYRFYAADMVHPSETAVEYIWEKFCETFVDANFAKTLRQGEKLSARLAHRPIIEDGSSREFREETICLVKEFLKQNPLALNPLDPGH